VAPFRLLQPSSVTGGQSLSRTGRPMSFREMPPEPMKESLVADLVETAETVNIRDDF
jgi:hypothetical protein